MLKVLDLTPLNGWTTSQRLRQVSNNVLLVGDGASPSRPAQVGAAGLDQRGVANWSGAVAGLPRRPAD